MQNCSLSAFFNFQFTGTQVNERVFPVFVGTSPVIGEITRYKYIRAIEYIQSFRINPFIFCKNRDLYSLIFCCKAHFFDDFVYCGNRMMFPSFFFADSNGG